jgi:carbon monoxide dehydrogenase subunit G
MAKVSTSKELKASPEKVWAIIADPSRFAEWNTLHTRWKDEPPAELSLGAQMTEVLTIMGMANTITFTTDEYDAPHSLTISGEGMAGAVVSMTLAVEPNGQGSVAKLDAEFKSQMMVGAIGKAIERASAKELNASLDKLTGLVS